MKRSCLTVAVASLIHAAPGAAQMLPSPPGDARIQTVDYIPDHIVTVAGSVGYQVTVALAPDEQVQNVAIGDPGSWQVAVNRAGNLLFVKPQANADTNMTVVTNARFYSFDLRAGSGNGPWELRFRYPAEMQLAARPAELIGQYRMHGAKSLTPLRISDDGERTFIDWSPETLLPATFTVDAHGRETLANGNMRDGVYVIDSVEERLVFRLDKQVARADRVVVGKHR